MLQVGLLLVSSMALMAADDVKNLVRIRDRLAAERRRLLRPQKPARPVRLQGEQGRQLGVQGDRRQGEQGQDQARRPRQVGEGDQGLRLRQVANTTRGCAAHLTSPSWTSLSWSRARWMQTIPLGQKLCILSRRRSSRWSNQASSASSAWPQRVPSQTILPHAFPTSEVRITMPNYHPPRRHRAAHAGGLGIAGSHPSAAADQRPRPPRWPATPSR